MAIGSSLFVCLERYLADSKAFPISVYVLDAVFFFAASLCLRFMITTGMNGYMLLTRQLPVAKRAIVIGAGSAARMLISEMQQPKSEYHIVGMVDDDPAKHRTKFRGVPVLAGIADLVELVSLHLIDVIIIAVPSATDSEMQRFIELCEQTRQPYRTMPSLRDLISGRAGSKEIREVNVEDLLEREPIKLDLESVMKLVSGNTVMVTGAAGSIGSELCSQLARSGIGKLLCVDQDETGIFDLQNSLLSFSDELDISFIVADIGNAALMQRVMGFQPVHFVFHAAAYEHVPLLEMNPFEAVRNNVLGLVTLLDVAEACGCERFLLISTDKAVNPSSLMGCTKRIGELIMASRPSNTMECISVRFRNVLGSQGSVVPAFQKQIREQGRVSVTHPEMTRFFMTIPEAVSLVLQAFVVGGSGDIMVLDMGTAVSILELARTLIRLSHKTPAEVPIVYSGLRPGEKLHEELFYAHERLIQSGAERVLRARGDRVSFPWLREQLEELDFACQTNDEASLRQVAATIVPEYTGARSLASGNAVLSRSRAAGAAV
ncbi:MAG: nucleoside-diphosphate sugar epimerase/dehydratase [Acidobacteriaceae bacterium]